MHLVLDNTSLPATLRTRTIEIGSVLVALLVYAVVVIKLEVIDPRFVSYKYYIR